MPMAATAWPGAGLGAGAAGAGPDPAGRKGALVMMDGLKLLGFGPRTGEAALELHGLLYEGRDGGDHPETLPLAGDRSRRARRLSVLLVGLLLVTALVSLGWGASGTSLLRAVSDWLAGRALTVQDRVVLLDIRLPRVLMGMVVGASLAVSGAVMQGLFRNPLADPGLVGVGAGAGLGRSWPSCWAGCCRRRWRGFSAGIWCRSRRFSAAG